MNIKYVVILNMKKFNLIFLRRAVMNKMIRNGGENKGEKTEYSALYKSY